MQSTGKRIKQQQQQLQRGISRTGFVYIAVGCASFSVRKSFDFMFIERSTARLKKSTRISTTSNDIQFNIICAWCANYCAFQTIFVILSRLPCAKQQLQFFCHNTFFVQNEVENLPLQRVDSEIVVYIDARVPVRCPNWCVIILLCSTII